LVVLGRQGAGKGTQCPLLADMFGLVHLSTGDILRESVRERAALGQQVAHYLDAGELVPDDLIVAVVLERLTHPDVAHRGYVLDGFPRTTGQAAALVKHEPDLDMVIDLQVPNEVVVARVTRRRVCPACSWVTAAEPHVAALPCERCDGVARRRSDDAEHAIRRRLALYDVETRPVAEWFARRDLLVEVDGLGEPDEVFTRILDALVPELRSQAPAGSR
jgi:adenylate kinase